MVEQVEAPHPVVAFVDTLPSVATPARGQGLAPPCWWMLPPHPPALGGRIELARVVVHDEVGV